MTPDFPIKVQTIWWRRFGVPKMTPFLAQFDTHWAIFLYNCDHGDPFEITMVNNNTLNNIRNIIVNNYSPSMSKFLKIYTRFLLQSCHEWAEHIEQIFDLVGLPSTNFKWWTKATSIRHEILDNIYMMKTHNNVSYPIDEIEAVINGNIFLMNHDLRHESIFTTFYPDI